MRDRLLPHPLLSLILALLWVLLANSLSPGHLLLGLLLGWLLPMFTRSFWPGRVHIRRPLVLARFLLLVLYDIVVANFEVAGLILRGPRGTEPRFVVVPLTLRTELALSLLANTVSLTPGTVSAWLAPDRRHLVVHGLRVQDPDALIDTIRRRYEAPLIEVFETC